MYWCGSALVQENRSLEVQLAHANRQVKQYRSELDKAGAALLGETQSDSLTTQTKNSTSSGELSYSHVKISFLVVFARFNLCLWVIENVSSVACIVDSYV